MNYNWKIYGKYACPACGWHLVRKRDDHNKAVSLCCHCNSEMIEIDPKTHAPIRQEARR